MSSSVVSQPFLTALADQAAPGSRDPLGLQPVWSRMGRMVVGNVTTVSADLQGWITLLVATGATEWIHEDSSPSENDFFETFLRLERLIAYSRAVISPDDVEQLRGVTRVRKKLERYGQRPIPIGRSSEAQILSGQRANGVWGQISAPARASGLLESQRNKLTEEARVFVRENYLSRLNSHRPRLVELAQKTPHFQPRKADHELARELASMHEVPVPPAQREFFRHHILFGQHAEHRDRKCTPIRDSTLQEQLVSLWTVTDLLEEPVTPEVVAGLETAAVQGGHDDLGNALKDIRTAESFLAPCDHLFAFLSTRHNQQVNRVAEEVESTWSNLSVAPNALDNCEPHVRDAYETTRPVELLSQVHSDLLAQDWESCVSSLQQLNGWIMRRRGAGPWLTLQDDRLDVRLRGNTSHLPESSSRIHWTHSYYLDQHRRLTRDVGGVSA